MARRIERSQEPDFKSAELVLRDYSNYEDAVLDGRINRKTYVPKLDEELLARMEYEGVKARGRKEKPLRK